MEAPPQRNALVLPDLLSVDLAAQRGCRGSTSRSVADKENINPNSLRLQQKQRKLAKLRAAKKAVAPSAAAAAPAATAPVAAAPSAAPPPASADAPLPKRLERMALEHLKDDLTSPPLAEAQGRHTSYMDRARSVRGGSTLSNEITLSDALSPVIR